MFHYNHHAITMGSYSRDYTQKGNRGTENCDTRILVTAATYHLMKVDVDPVLTWLGKTANTVTSHAALAITVN